MIELHPLACAWARSITEGSFFVEEKVDDPMLLGEVLPRYDHPMAAHISSETDLALIRSGPLREDFDVLAAGLLVMFSLSSNKISGFSNVRAPPPGRVDAPLTITSKQDSEAQDPVPV